MEGAGVADPGSGVVRGTLYVEDGTAEFGTVAFGTATGVGSKLEVGATLYDGATLATPHVEQPLLTVAP